MTYSCKMNGAGAFDYLNQLQLQADAVAKNPECWQPLNYREQVDKSQAA